MPRKESYLCLMEEWEAKLNQEKKSKYTVRSYTAAVKLALKILKEQQIQTTPSRLSQEDIEMLMGRMNTGVYKMGLLGFLRSANNPHIERANIQMVKKTMNRADWLDLELEQDAQVWEAALNLPLMEKALTHFELHLALRRSSVQRLIMPWYLGKHLIVLGKGVKGGKFRTIPTHPFTADTMQEILDYRADVLEPLSLRIGKPVPENIITYKKESCDKFVTPSDTTLDRLLKNVSLRSGLKFSHHTLRRTCGRSIFMEMMDQNKVNLPAIQQFLGHEDLQMTIHYLGINMYDVEAMMTVGSQRHLKRLQTLNCTSVKTLAL